MLNLKNKSVCLLGYGKSNQALMSYLLSRGIFPTVRNDTVCQVPNGIKLLYGKNYLKTTEDIIFRTPVIRPDSICGSGKISSEIAYTLSILKSHNIGVTGSDGKSTTSTLIYKILAEEHRAVLGGNIGTPLIEKAEGLTKDDFAVLELSSFQLMDFCPRLEVGVITNITENHLDWHKSMDEYIEAKKNILKNAKVCVLNYDDEIVRHFAKDADVFVTLSDKFDCISHYCDTRYNFVYPHKDYIYYNTDKIINIGDILIKGEYNLRNVLSAIGATYNFASNKSIKNVLRTFEGISSRREFIKNVNGVSFFDSSIDSTTSRTKETLSTFDKEKTIIILGGYDKNLDYSPLSCCLSDIKGVVLCGENKNKIFEAIKNLNIEKIIFENDFDSCVRRAYSLACCGDSVLLSPASASFDMFENYKERAERFKQIVNTLM